MASRKSAQTRLGQAAADALRFEDGKIEQYQNRPRSRVAAPLTEPNLQGQTAPLWPNEPFSDAHPDFCRMTYPDFHSKYAVKRAKVSRTASLSSAQPFLTVTK